MTLPKAKSRVVSDSPEANPRERRVESGLETAERFRELWKKFAGGEFRNEADRDCAAGISG